MPTKDIPFPEAIAEIVRKDPRYEPDAYFFLREALDFTSKLLNKPHAGPGRHLSGAELLDGIRKFALQEYGPMALTLLKTWGITRTEDVGEIVFNLVESGKLGKTDNDKREDFANGYDFFETFARPFLPKSQTKSRKSSARREGTSRKRKRSPGKSAP